MKRKLLSLILVVAMLASMAIFVPAASATENVATVKTTNAVGSAGDEVTVDVTITVDSFAGFQLAFVYDSSRLTYNGVSYDQTGSSFAPAGAAQNQQFVNYGPYTLIGRAWQDAEGNTFLFENCEDTKFATLSFTIKEDAPAGDAYVEFCSLNGVYNDAAYRYDKISRSAQLGISDDILYEGSVVTVLPEGYEALPVVDDGAWVFENGVISGCNDASLATYTGLFVFPSEINGEAVTTIAARAFEEYAWSSVVIPASVTLVEEGAIHTCANLTKVYVLNPETVLEPMSIGWDVVYNATTGAVNTRRTFVTVDANDEVVTAFYGVAGSTAQVYAETGDEDMYFFSFYAELPPYTISFGGATYSVPATVKLPGSAVVDGKTVVAWQDGDKTFAAGATVTLTENLVLEPVTITAPVTSTEVDFKLAAKEADLAMRFTASLSKADYATLASLGTVELGMLITPAKRVAQAGSFTKEALDALEVTHKYVDIAIDGYYKETTDDYILAGSLKGFSASTLANNPDFAAIVYATVTTAGGDTFTVYGDFNFDANQDVKSVAEAIVETNITNDQKTWLNTLIGKFTA